MTFDFRPTETPFGIPVLTTFTIKDRVYVVDTDGLVFQLQIEGDDPELWTWQLVIDL